METNITLYGISADMQDLMARIEENGGELTPELEQELDITGANLQTKAVSVAHTVKYYSDMAALAKAKKAEMAEYQKRWENTAERIRDYLARCMTACGIDKIESGIDRLSFRRSEAVVVTDAEALPDDLVTVKVERVPDKAAIKAAIKAGRAVEGAVIEEHKSLNIK